VTFVSGLIAEERGRLRAFVLSVGLLTSPAYAEQCSGRLTVDRGELILTTKGEDICVIGKSDESKVLAGCSLGHYCVVTGTVDYCKDSGECVEVTHVIRARGRR
jgi:hypothetical protein